MNQDRQSPNGLPNGEPSDRAGDVPEVHKPDPS